jgi:hypothetical protein
MSVIVTVGMRRLSHERDSEARRSWCNKMIASRYPVATNEQRSSDRSDTTTLFDLLLIRGIGRGRHDDRSVWPAARKSEGCGRPWFRLRLSFNGLRARGAMGCNPLAAVFTAVCPPASARFAERVAA